MNVINSSSDNKREFNLESLFALFKKLFLLLIAGGVIAAFLFNERGLISWYKYSMERERIESELDSLHAVESALRTEIEKLKFAPEYLEKLAREKYGMAKKGEKVYKVIPKEEAEDKE
ncbi:MAG: septum formation initiator family protein [Candidatus Marinimicrobia bacterium]|nr:septum formation initiator family protein [Candidatus Neomarinimicrobiota bacterium]